jgi:hypothetical protein
LTKDQNEVSPYAKYTVMLLLAVAFGLGIYDCWVGYVCGGSATISWILWTAAQKYPAIAFGFGFLMGHLFAQMSK